MAAIPYRIRRSDRARRARIHVTAEGVEVVVPRRLALREVEPFVEEKRRWIERTLRRMQEAEAEFPAPLLRDGGQVPLLGERLTLRIRVEPRRVRPHVARRGDELHMAVALDEHVRDALERWYRRLARDEIAPRLGAAAKRTGARVERLTIRGQRTRWASCSSAGTMSFNWRLLLAPPEILDYVIEHEVAHLEVHDHSQRFWTLLEERCPQYAEREAWLKRHGQSLRL